jgi:protein-tyrosine phosphatase
MSLRDIESLRANGSIDRHLTLMLKHPYALSAKKFIKDAWWEFRGPAIRNPLCVARPRSLLFVCKGNICRSPFAALAAERWLREAGVQGVSTDSAGIAASCHGRSPLPAIEAARRYGIDLGAHCAMSLTDPMVRSNDAIVVMEPPHLQLLRRTYQERRDRLYLLPLWVPEPRRGRGQRRYSIIDPFGKPRRDFDACYSHISEALEGMLKQMFASIDTGPRS